MKKIRDDGKEETCAANSVNPLSDEELSCTSGGTGSVFHSRWVCVECGFHGAWSTSSRIRAYEQNFHYQQTGHYNFKTETRYTEPGELPED